MIELIYGNDSGKIVIKNAGNGFCRLKLRVPARGIAHESLDIKIDVEDLRKLGEVLESREVCKIKLGKSKGLFKEYLLVEREQKNSRFKLELNSWFLVLGASLGDRVDQEDASNLTCLIKSNF